jgi:L-ribulose-5-phosphate 3-epimerase UlaE
MVFLFLVETGNNNNSEIGNFFHKMTKQPAFEGSLRSISFVTKDSCRAIQLADFFAFYSRRHMRNHHRFPGGMRCQHVRIFKSCKITGGFGCRLGLPD